jgi:hypothetical protein
LALPSSALDRPHAPRVSDGFRGEPGSSVSPLDVVCIEIEPARFLPPPPPLLSRLLRADAPTNVTPAAASSTDTPEKMTDENLFYIWVPARGARRRGARRSFSRWSGIIRTHAQRAQTPTGINARSDISREEPHPRAAHARPSSPAASRQRFHDDGDDDARRRRWK